MSKYKLITPACHKKGIRGPTSSLNNVELVPPPPISLRGALVFRLRVFPLRVVVPFGDCGDTPRASAHHLGLHNCVSVPSTRRHRCHKHCQDTHQPRAFALTHLLGLGLHATVSSQPCPSDTVPLITGRRGNTTPN